MKPFGERCTTLETKFTRRHDAECQLHRFLISLGQHDDLTAGLTVDTFRNADAQTLENTLALAKWVHSLSPERIAEHDD